MDTQKTAEPVGPCPLPMARSGPLHVPSSRRERIAGRRCRFVLEASEVSGLLVHGATLRVYCRGGVILRHGEVDRALSGAADPTGARIAGPEELRVLCRPKAGAGRPRLHRCDGDAVARDRHRDAAIGARVAGDEIQAGAEGRLNQRGREARLQHEVAAARVDRKNVRRLEGTVGRAAVAAEGVAVVALLDAFDLVVAADRERCRRGGAGRRRQRRGRVRRRSGAGRSLGAAGTCGRQE